MSLQVVNAKKQLSSKKQIRFPHAIQVSLPATYGSSCKFAAI